MEINLAAHRVRASGRGRLAALLVCFLGLAAPGCGGDGGGGGGGETDWIVVPGGASFRGSPSYISEFQTDWRDNGGPVSDYGSHFGIKAEVEGRSFGGIRHFACITGPNFLDYTRTGFAGVSSLSAIVGGGEGSSTLFQAAEDRKITFEPFGWTEQATEGGWRATMRTAFLATDAFYLIETIENSTGATASVAPVFSFASKASRMKASHDRAENAAVLEFVVSTSLGAGKNWLAVLPDFTISRFEAGSSSGGTTRIEGPSAEVGASAKKTFTFYLGYSPDSAADAIARAKAGQARAAGDPEAAWAEVGVEWDRFFQGLPAPHTSDPRFVDLYRTAATALRMTLYAPRGAMDRFGAVPTKVHYNWMWLWDSGFQGLGYSEIDAGIAEEITWSVFESQQEDGYIAHMTSDQLKPLSPHSQSPVFGWTASQIAARDPDRARAADFVRRVYEASERFLEWWWANRDHDGDGVYEFLSQDESGWDNSPRRLYCGYGPNIPYFGLACEMVASQTKPMDSADLNPWLILYYRAMADWATELGMGSEVADGWRARAETLGRRMDEVLWSEEKGAWFDTYGGMHGAPHTHWEVLTPAIWFAAFADTTTDLTKVRRVIEEHILNPEEFYGRYPMPTVAYNDPFFNVETPGWLGYVWLVTLYPSLPVLYRYGYEEEAAELRQRTLEMMAEQGGMHGIYETYSPVTGGYKVPQSNGTYASFQFGWSSTFTMEILLERYQSERFVFPDTMRFEGFVRQAREWGPAGRAVYEADVEPGHDVPRVRIESADGRPLLESEAIDVTLGDPYGTLAVSEVPIRVLGERVQAEVGRTRRLSLPRSARQEGR